MGGGKIQVHPLKGDQINRLCILEKLADTIYTVQLVKKLWSAPLILVQTHSCPLGYSKEANVVHLSLAICSGFHYSCQPQKMNPPSVGHSQSIIISSRFNFPYYLKLLIIQKLLNALLRCIESICFYLKKNTIYNCCHNLNYNVVVIFLKWHFICCWLWKIGPFSSHFYRWY